MVKNTEADDDAASPSETDSSSMLETVSLDLDDDRREETGDRSLKNRRWHKVFVQGFNNNKNQNVLYLTTVKFMVKYMVF